MKSTTLRLCVSLIIMTTQQSVASLIIPPFLHDLKYPVSAIGSLIALSPIFALLARLPAGMVYRPRHAPLLMSGALALVAVSNSLYAFAVSPVAFALVHGLNGFAFSAATTLHLAFFVETLPPGENRHHAMGFYAGSMATGYAAGGFTSGYIADRLGYAATFHIAALLALVAVALVFLFPAARSSAAAPKTNSIPKTGGVLRAIMDPRMAAVVVVAVFLNILHQMGSAFLPLYGLAVGLTLTDIGIIKGIYSLANAVTRPLSGLVANRFGARGLMLASIPLQAMVMALLPLFDRLAPLLIVFVVIGFLRAVAIVGNTIQMVESSEQARLGRGMASGVFNASSDLGNIAGPSAGGLIASVTGVTYLFLFGPLIFVALFLLSLWGRRFLPEPKRS